MSTRAVAPSRALVPLSGLPVEPQPIRRAAPRRSSSRHVPLGSDAHGDGADDAGADVEADAHALAVVQSVRRRYLPDSGDVAVPVGVAVVPWSLGAHWIPDALPDAQVRADDEGGVIWHAEIAGEAHETEEAARPRVYGDVHPQRRRVREARRRRTRLADGGNDRADDHGRRQRCRGGDRAKRHAKATPLPASTLCRDAVRRTCTAARQSSRFAGRFGYRPAPTAIPGLVDEAPRPREALTRPRRRARPPRQRAYHLGRRPAHHLGAAPLRDQPRTCPGHLQAAGLTPPIGPLEARLQASGACGPAPRGYPPAPPGVGATKAGALHSVGWSSPILVDI